MTQDRRPRSEQHIAMEAAARARVPRRKHFPTRLKRSLHPLSNAYWPSISRCGRGINR